MPGLIGYMLAIVVTLGGYFAALNWLISPPDPWQLNPKLSQSASQRPASKKRLPPAVRPAEAAIAQETTASTGRDVNLASVETSIPVQESEPASIQPSEIEVEPAIARKIAGTVPPMAEPARIMHRDALPMKTKPGNRKRAQRNTGRKLELMVLRTYQRSDGKRFTRLLPIERTRNALAFQPDNAW
jgi:hypothetical protein